MDKPRPCPFCGKKPFLAPVNPDKEGNTWGSVACINKRCPAHPVVYDGILMCDERGSDVYKQAAIRRWNEQGDKD